MRSGIVHERRRGLSRSIGQLSIWPNVIVKASYLFIYLPEAFFLYVYVYLLMISMDDLYSTSTYFRYAVSVTLHQAVLGTDKECTPTTCYSIRNPRSNKNTDKEASSRLQYEIVSSEALPANDGDDDMIRSTGQRQNSALIPDRESHYSSSQSALSGSRKASDNGWMIRDS